MKRIGNLITEDRITINFCKEAICEASYRKRGRDNVLKVLNNIDNYAKELRDMILNETYVPAPYGFEIRIEHGKERKLQKPKFFPDQIIHHILIMLIRDKILKRIDPYAVASIPNKGNKYGVDTLKKWIQTKNTRDTKYCGKGDIRKCFENVKPDVVMNMYKRMIKDKKWLKLMKKVVYSCESLPLGNYCSAWTLNLLLKPLDEAIRRADGVTHYLRFMDDFVFFSANKRKAKRIREIIKEELAKLGLELKHTYQLFKIDDRGLDMIGYRIFRNRIILRKRNFKKIMRLAHIFLKRRLYTVYNCQSFISILGQGKHCDAKYIYKIVGSKVDVYKMKDVIREESRRISYGDWYIPSVILLRGA